MGSPELKVLYLIQLPPPIHGVSTVNAVVFNSELINEGVEKILLELKFSSGLRELRRNRPGKIIRFFRLSRALRSVLRERRPDLVYFSVMPVGKGFWRDLLLVRIVRKSGTRIIFHLHNRGMHRHIGNPFRHQIYRYVFSGSVIIHLSEGLIEKEIRPLRLKNIRAYAIANGIHDVKSGKRQEGHEGIQLLFLSNFFPEKGIYDSLRIMSMLRRERSGIRLRLVGDFLRDGHRKKLISLIRRMGLTDLVSVAEPKYGTEKEQEYRNADVFIFPSYFRQECFPLVLLEAMSFSLPIVSSRIGAIPEMIESGKEGILLDERDLHGFVKEIAALSGNPDRRIKLGTAARKKFERSYTLDQFESRIRKVIKDSRS